jgi:hypothetical protein
LMAIAKDCSVSGRTGDCARVSSINLANNYISADNHRTEVL